MQTRIPSVPIAIGLAAIIIASAVVLLTVSVQREFVPGIVELSVALGIAGLFAVAMLLGVVPSTSLEARLKNVQTGEILFATAGAALFAITAALAALSEGFPWPLPLVGVVLLMAAALRRTSGSSRVG